MKQTTKTTRIRFYGLVVNFWDNFPKIIAHAYIWRQGVDSMVSHPSLSHCRQMCQVLVTERSQIWKMHSLSDGSNFPFEYTVNLLSFMWDCFRLQETQAKKKGRHTETKWDLAVHWLCWGRNKGSVNSICYLLNFVLCVCRQREGESVRGKNSRSLFLISDKAFAQIIR